MAATFVRSTGKQVTGGAGSLAASFGALPAAGNFILVQIWGWNSTEDLDMGPSACTDNQGNTYTRAIQGYYVYFTGVPAIYYAYNIGTPSGTFTVTVDPTGSAGTMTMVATEWSGLGLVDSLDVAEATREAVDLQSQPSVGPSQGTTQADELVAALFSSSVTQASIVVETATPAWTERAEELDQTFQVGEAVTRVVTAIQPQSCSWTYTLDHWSGCLASFKAAAGADSSDLFRLPSA